MSTAFHRFSFFHFPHCPVCDCELANDNCRLRCEEENAFIELKFFVSHLLPGFDANDMIISDYEERVWETLKGIFVRVE